MRTCADVCRTDAAGKTVGGELERIGWIGDEEVGARKLAAFFELHIEQGPILEDENIDIGVVTHGQGLNWLQVTLTGKEAHTGSTPMPKRVNAGLGMARITQLVDEIAWSHAPLAVGAVGHCDVYPNSRNIIPGKVVFTVDFRHPKQEVIDDMEARLRAGAAEICKEIGLEMEIEQAGKFDPVEFDDGCVGAIRRAAEGTRPRSAPPARAPFKRPGAPWVSTFRLSKCASAASATPRTRLRSMVAKRRNARTVQRKVP